ncbi:AAA family ATPase [Variovorax paradoxus]|uniref:AAA family ATPase n=1 Tax=Variovorax paradoxus TaxID=34073 RepID=UPI0003688993|nr:AAA family ATPase [Variovorax paradoxus]
MDQSLADREVYAYIGPRPPLQLEADLSFLVFVPDTFQVEGPVVRAELFWCGVDRIPTHFASTLLVLADEPKTASVEASQIERVISFADLQKMLGSCVTFIARRRSYRELIEIAGVELAKRLLTKANDAAALQAFVPKSRVLQRLRASGLLQKMLVTDEDQFSFLSLRKIFAETDEARDFPPEIASLSARLSIDGGRSEFTFVADFDEVLREAQPVTAVIGANGVGKTRLLLALADAALRGRLEVKSGWQESPWEPIRSAELLSFTYEPSSWLRQRRAGAHVIALGVGAREWKRLCTLLQQLAISDSAEFQVNAYARVIADVVQPDHLLIPIARGANHPAIRQIGYQRYIPLAALVERVPRILLGQLETNKEVIAWSSELGRYSLSSGQRSLLLLVAQLFLYGERALVLIDEPENHLHPQYVTLLMQTLQSTLIAMESRAVIVTHSPFVVRELDKTAVQILGRDTEAIPCIFQTSLQTLGADVGRISEYVFADYEVRKGYERRIDRVLAAGRTTSPTELEQTVVSSLGDDAQLYLYRALDGLKRAD